jgi:hypothetical protein
MFASKINAQFPRFISYRPDPGANPLTHFLPKGSSKVGAGQGNWSSGNPQLANASMVINGNENVDQPSSPSKAQCETVAATQLSTRRTPTIQETGCICLPLVRRQLQAEAFHNFRHYHVCLVEHSTKQYQTSFKKWKNYCNS